MNFISSTKLMECMGNQDRSEKYMVTCIVKSNISKVIIVSVWIVQMGVKTVKTLATMKYKGAELSFQCICWSAGRIDDLYWQLKLTLNEMKHTEISKYAMYDYWDIYF